jgi:hypothetical protein
VERVFTAKFGRRHFARLVEKEVGISLRAGAPGIVLRL